MSNSSRCYACVLLTVALFSSLSFAASPDRISGPIDSGNVVALLKSVHPKAQAKYDQGRVDPSLKLAYMTLLTTPSAAQQAALNQLLAQQQDRTSANYHKWLTPAQYADQFGLSQGDLNRITSWLQSKGFKVLDTGGGRNSVIFSGTAAQVQSAFKTEIHEYNVNGEQHFANSTPIMIPAALQGIVAVIRGLNNFRMHAASQAQLGTGPRTRPQYYDGDFIFPNFLAPGDVATIYNFSSLSNGTTTIDGTGESIAVIGETDIFLADINDFRSGFNLPTINPSNCTSNSTTGVITSCNDPHFKYILVGSDPGAPDSVQKGDITEADLDVEWSGAVAQNAQIIFVNAPDPAGHGVDDSLSYALNPPSGTPIPAPVVTMSYGLCEVEATSEETELQQGVAEGITIVNSSGDSGGAACDNNPPNASQPFSPAVGGLAVNYPASSTYVVAAGGTAITLANDSYPNAATTYWGTSNGTNGGTALQHIPETPWNDDEEFADYCASPAPGDTFCSTGNGTTNWVSITSPPTGTTAAQAAQEDIWINAGGGGASNCFTKNTEGVCTAGIPQPTWQKNLVITTPNTAGVRWVPDVAFLASPNFPGYIYCTPLNPDATPADYTSSCADGIFDAVDQNNSLVGGTSVSAPLFAGIVALLNQYLAGPSSPGLGDIHPMLYQLAATPSDQAFYPVASGDNRVYCEVGQPSNQTVVPGIICPSSGIFGYTSSGTGNFDPTTGYNLVTGLGSVNVAELASAWAGTRGATAVSISASATQVESGASVTFTATLSSTTALGNINFFDNGSTTALGTVALTKAGNGVVTFSTTTLPAGANSVTAGYAGDGSNNPSTSSVPATVTVIAPFTVSPTSSSATLSAGQTNTSTVTVTPMAGFTSSVTLSCPSTPAGITCTFTDATQSVPQSSITVSMDGVHAVPVTVAISTVPNMASGAQTVTVSATGAGATQTSTVGLTITGTTETFSLSAPSAASYTVQPGQSATVNVTVSSSTGFLTGPSGSQTTAVPLTYSCSDAASESLCTTSTSTTSATSLSFTITTTAPTGQLRRPFDRGSRILYAALLPGLLGIMFTFGSRRRTARLRGMRLLGLIMVLGFSTLWLGSCSGSNNGNSGNPGTPPNTYTITISATTGGQAPITNQPPLTVQLVVQ
jgi:hypothetical protein